MWTANTEQFGKEKHSQEMVQLIHSCGGPRNRSWWAREDLNLGPLPCQGSALTPELRARAFRA